ncbi:uncharacterized protein BDFB_009532, partial [Asbolus verrucosus]
NMDSNSISNGFPTVEIEEDDVIDLDDAEKTPEEVIYEWDAKIRKKLSMFAVADNENILGDLMKEYLQSLQEMATIYEDNESLKNKVFCHVSFLYSYYIELQCCTPDNYLNNMEDILTSYCNLELEVIYPLKRKDFSKREYKRRILSVCRRIIHILTVYLLERNDHILHVLIKMNTNSVSDSSSEVLNVLYTHFLTKVPAFNLCDESFCRNYIVFQKWKKIRKTEDWEGMDKIMYKMFKRTPESIKDNETLRQILMPSCQSTDGIVLNLFRSFRDISDAYFKHVIAKKNIEMEDLDFNIDLGEDEPTLPVEDENDEEVTFLKAFYEVERNMSNLMHSTKDALDVFRRCKEEMDEDDDVEFVGVITSEQQVKEHFVISDETCDYRNNNVNTIGQLQDESLSATTSLLSSTKEKSLDLENLNGITKAGPVGSNFCSSMISQATIDSFSPNLSSTSIESVLENNLLEIAAAPETVVEAETNQPKVPLVSNATQVPSPSPSATNDSVLVCENGGKKTIQTKDVEIQANDNNCVYNDYGLTTPPFDVPTDEHSARSVEPCSNLSENVCEKNVVTRTVEVQVDPPSSNKNCLYNNYGLTPPNDTAIDDHNSRSGENCLYTNIGQSHKSAQKVVEQDYNNRDSQQVQISEAVQRLESECQDRVMQIDDNAQEIIENESNATDGQTDVNCEPEILPNTKKKVVCATADSSMEESHKNDLTQALTIEHDSDDDFDNQLDISEMTNIDTEYDTEEIDVESCPETDKDNPSVHEKDKGNPLVQDESSNHTTVCEHIEAVNVEINVNSELVPLTIDTGQKVILNTAPNIDKEPVIQPDLVNVEDSPEAKDFLPVPETFNGNTVLKPLLSSNRTNGQTKDISGGPTKIMYTSSQKINSTSLDDFSKFESAIQIEWSKMKENHDFEEILTGPVTKITPTKHTALLGPQDKLDIFAGMTQESNPKPITSTNSRSNSPTEMTSPAYEAIDDFRNYFSDSVNGRVPPPHDVRVPQGILKKTNSTRKKNYRIMFHESTRDDSEERRLRSDGVLVQKRVRRDRKLNMEPRVIVERLSFIENKMKKVLNNPPTLRVDYDKTTRHINEKDVVRCISPPRFSWIIDFSRSRHNTGKAKRSNDDYCKKALSKCEKNKSLCCNQLAEQFTKLNCNVSEEKALNLTIPDNPAP